jgi:hypothetical protein
MNPAWLQQQVILHAGALSIMASQNRYFSLGSPDVFRVFSNPSQSE